MASDIAVELSITETTRQCFRQFTLCVEKLRGPQSVYIKNCQADFKLWVDSVGAVAQGRGSLDSRFSHRPDDIYLIKELIILLQIVLTECITASSKESTDEVLGKIGSILRDLIAIGVAIRRSGRKFRLQKADASFDHNRDEYRDLQAHLATLVMSSPSEGPRTLVYQDRSEPSQLSPIQHRLVEANLRRRHRFMEMQRHSHLLKDPMESPLWEGIGHILTTMGPSSSQKVSDIYSVKPGHTKSTTTSMAQSNSMTVVETIASIPETGFRGLQRGGRIDSTVTRITAITAAARYPRAKLSNSEQLSFKCPCCCHAIPIQEAEGNRFKTHLANDICPYTCILEHCPTPLKLFVTEKEWKEHFLNDHPPEFQCSYCDSAPFISLVEIMGHLQLEHPDISDDELADALAESPVHIMGIGNCPLCDSEDSPDSPELIEHVLQHIHDFSLRSLPWPQDRRPHLNKTVGNFNLAIDNTDQIISWVLETSPDSKCDLQLCELDKNPPMEAETASDNFKDDYFSQNDYFVADSSDGNLHSKRTPDSSQMTRPMETSELGDTRSMISTEDEDQTFTVRRKYAIPNEYTAVQAYFQKISNATPENGDDSNEETRRLNEEADIIDTWRFHDNSPQLSGDDESNDEDEVFSQEYLEERKQAYQKDMESLREQLPQPPLEDPHIVSLLMRIQLLGKIAQEQTIEPSPEAVDTIQKDHNNVPSDLKSLSNTHDVSYRRFFPPRVDPTRPSSKLDHEGKLYKDIRTFEPGIYGDREFRPFVDRVRENTGAHSREHYERPYPRRGTTIIPRKFVQVHPIWELGYDFKEEEDNIIIQKALSREQIREVINLSQEFGRLIDKKTGRDHDGDPVDQTIAGKRIRSPDNNHRYRMDSPHGAIYPSNEASIMPPPPLLPPSRYRDIEYEEEIKQIERPKTKNTSPPRSESMDARGLSSSPIPYFELRSVPIENSRDFEPLIPTRLRGSDQDMSDLVREMEDATRQLKKQEEGKEKVKVKVERILSMKEEEEEEEERILLMKKKMEEEEEEEDIPSTKKKIEEKGERILLLKKKIEDKEERILLMKKEIEEAEGDMEEDKPKEPSPSLVRAMMATLT